MKTKFEDPTPIRCSLLTPATAANVISWIFFALDNCVIRAIMINMRQINDDLKKLMMVRS
jgi:hypothetical protein